MTPEQFYNEVSEAIRQHVSRDNDVSLTDQQDETLWVARTLSSRLKLWFPDMPLVEDLP